MFAAVIPARPLPITTTSYSSFAPWRKSFGMASRLPDSGAGVGVWVQGFGVWVQGSAWDATYPRFRLVRLLLFIHAPIFSPLRRIAIKSIDHSDLRCFL